MQLENGKSFWQYNNILMLKFYEYYQIIIRTFVSYTQWVEDVCHMDFTYLRTIEARVYGATKLYSYLQTYMMLMQQLMPSPYLRIQES